METISPTPSLADATPATLFVALELSRSTWLVALHSPIADKVSQHRLEGGDTAGLLALIGRKREMTAAKLGGPVRVLCCFEAGYDGFWLHRWLCAHGIENRVLDAASLLVDRRARRAKTDRLDAAGLLRTLMAWSAARRRCAVSCTCRLRPPELRPLRRHEQGRPVSAGLHHRGQPSRSRRLGGGGLTERREGLTQCRPGREGTPSAMGGQAPPQPRQAQRLRHGLILGHGRRLLTRQDRHAVNRTAAIAAKLLAECTCKRPDTVGEVGALGRGAV